MSKKSNKGGFTYAKGTFHSLSDLGKACGLKESEMDERTKKCRKCGKTMTHVDGTNVYLCPECGKHVLQHVQSTPSTLI